ncbi:hypothetical protein [Allorhodopirellula heiligendammensis]|uniref:DUF4412 domain-containing protein n=1 Tax=Allorhodopirellula heiligendammensis TaxID=2714739 RepID=A0A5C6BG38_9BACT|nr:hypothetical protein [Allorhodopirellula heiligendammensis]TWU10461.1 hypothetical protein Poly21_43650 [Allorhodopirellula heiligendammensis]|tara:strand:+ start:1708 stop:2499 length:792 start_codon:yes stop_codon:yes gene_type:complete
MTLTRGKRIQVVLLACAGALMMAATTRAQDTLVSTAATPRWVVLTEVFQGDAKQPHETHHIVFQNGIYYDFPASDAQSWTVFDLTKSRVILLDRERQERTSIPMEDLVQLTARAETELTNKDQRARFGMDAQPAQANATQFSIQFDDTEYHISGVRPQDPEVAAQYGRFVDWVCRLNIARPRGVPPFARMKLNDLMTAQNILPRETSVTLTRHLGAERIAATIRLRSMTSHSSEIDETLAGQIQDAQTMRVVFNEVPWDQYEH